MVVLFPEMKLPELPDLTEQLHEYCVSALSNKHGCILSTGDYKCIGSIPRARYGDMLWRQQNEKTDIVTILLEALFSDKTKIQKLTWEIT